MCDVMEVPLNLGRNPFSGKSFFSASYPVIGVAFPPGREREGFGLGVEIFTLVAGADLGRVNFGYQVFG